MTGLTSAALCMGYGGLDLAVEQVLGTSLAWCAEFDDAPSKVIEHHWPGLTNYRDLTAIDWSTVPPVDVLTAGYPCQPFSHAGRRKGTDDPRHLWPYIAECLRVLRPRLAIFENVAGHLSLGLDAVLADLAALGFDAEWVAVRASDVGACHQRKRLFIAAADAERGRWDGWWSQGPDGAGHRDEAGQRWAARAGEAAADARRHGLSGGAEQHGAAPAGLDRESGRHADGCGVEAARRAGVGADEPAADADDATVNGERARPEPRQGNQVSPDAPSIREREPSDEALAIAAGREARTLAGSGGRGTSWGDYGPAIERHARVLGRSAPSPVDEKGRLAPRFVEWMQMLPEGHVCDVPDLTRAQQLKILGNGVVPPQAAYAVNHLLERGGHLERGRPAA